MRTPLFALVLLLLLPYSLLAQQLNKAFDLSIHNSEKINQLSTYFPIVQRKTDLNTCNTWSFQMEFSSSQSEHPTDILQLPTSSYILCGNSVQGSGTNGRLIKLAPNGHAVLSKQLSIPGKNVELNKIHFISKGYLYAIGTSTDVNTGNSEPILVNIDTATLAILSIVNCQINQGPQNWKGYDLAEQPDSYIYFLAYNDSLINVTAFIPGSMNILWSKTYHPRNHPQIVGIGSFDAVVYVGWNEKDSGFTKGVVLSLDYTTGNFTSEFKVGGAADGLNVEFQSMTVSNVRPRFTAIQYNNNNQASFVRVNFDGYAPFREIFSISGLNPSPNMVSQQNLWAESIAFQQQPGNSQLSVIQTLPDNYYNEAIRTWNINFPTGLSLRRHAMCIDGGNIALADYSGGIMVCKMDSVVAVCNSTQVPSSSNVQFDMPFLNETLNPQSYTFQFSNISLPETDIALTETVLCQTLSCPIVPEPEVCQRTFIKEYRNYTNAVTARQLLNIGNGNMFITGGYRLRDFMPTSIFSITKIDTSGQIIDARALAGASITKVIKLHDGNLLGVGYVWVNSTPDLYLVKFDSQYSIIWQRR